MNTLHCFCLCYGGITYLLSVDKRLADSIYGGALPLPTVTYLRHVLCMNLCLPRKNKESQGRFFFFPAVFVSLFQV